jgi:tetratricopeptide (TPR) repeat protein
MGCVDEPFLGGTPEIGTFFERFLYFGFSFGEAAYAAQTCLSWQTTIVGDPLYSPFKIPAAERHRELESRRSKWLEWSYLRLVNLKLLHKVPTAEVTLLLEELPLTKTSPVLEEKLAELYAADDKTSFAQNALRTALKLDPSPQQRTRITLLLADRLAASGNNAEAYDLLDKLLAWYPDYPNPTPVLDQLGDLARKLGRPADAEHFARKRAELLPKNP